MIGTQEAYQNIFILTEKSLTDLKVIKVSPITLYDNDIYTKTAGSSILIEESEDILEWTDEVTCSLEAGEADDKSRINALITDDKEIHCKIAKGFVHLKLFDQEISLPFDSSLTKKNREKSTMH